MSARSIEAARAFVRVAWEDNAVKKGISNAIGMMKGFAVSAAKIAGGMAVYDLAANAMSKTVAAVQEFASSGAAIDDVSKRTGASAEALSQLKYAAEQSGASLSDIEKGMRKLGDVSTSAANGSKAAQQSLRAVGLSAKDLEDMSPEQKLLAVAEGLKSIEDPGQRASVAMDILGKSGASLLPMMEDGAAGIQKMMQEADTLGLTLSGDQAAAAADYDDAMAKMSATIATVGKYVATLVLPYMTQLLNVITQAIPYVIQFGRDLGAAIINGASAAWKAIKELAAGFQPLIDTVKETFLALTGALMSGEYSAAAKVLWTSLKAAWMTGVDALSHEWMLWKKAFLDTFNSAIHYVQKEWMALQNMLANASLSIMAYFDSSINLDEASATLEEDYNRRIQAADEAAKRNQQASDAQFEADVTKVNQDLEQARQEWKDAVTQANNVAEKKANEPTAAAAADDKFTQLIESLQSGDIATRINDTVKGASSSAVTDVRTVSGASQLASVLNRNGEVSKQMLAALRQIVGNTKELGIGEVVSI